MPSILLVDSPGESSALLVSALRAVGVEVVLASSPAETRAALAHPTFALAVVDLMRGDSSANGLAIAREIKRVCPAIRVLLTSAYHLSERQIERADCGVSGFIPKPYDVVEVVSFLQEKLSGPPSSRRLSAASAALATAAQWPCEGDPGEPSGATRGERVLN